MTTALIKKKLTQAINEIDDAAFLSALHTIVDTKMEEYRIRELSAVQKNELEERKARYKTGKNKTYTLSSLKKALISK
ncbi:MAG TPA: hypothetical protein PLO99_04940 [Chitinophagaceae bacterium]|jgi:hypothetical protein|nr:hypothetical protein [Chitinophagaceae bacterium]HRG92353.1 hypothetical protein [Chitinophagaceae bacterium]